MRIISHPNNPRSLPPTPTTRSSSSRTKTHRPNKMIPIRSTHGLRIPSPKRRKPRFLIPPSGYMFFVRYHAVDVAWEWGGADMVELKVAGGSSRERHPWDMAGGVEVVLGRRWKLGIGIGRGSCRAWFVKVDAEISPFFECSCARLLREDFLGGDGEPRDEGVGATNRRGVEVGGLVIVVVRGLLGCPDSLPR